jgi:hypothetical protein
VASRPDLERSRQRVLDVAVAELLPRLVELGTVGWLSGGWAGCEDFGREIQFVVEGRVELPPGAPRPAGDPLLATLAAAGWAAGHDWGEGSRRRGLRRGELRFELVEYDDDFVLVSLNGPCLGADQAILDALLGQPRTHLVTPD